MVKLSRRGASNGRSRRSLKKRLSRKQVLKGGKYDVTKSEHNRIKDGRRLYQLSTTTDGPNKVYTLDFSKVGGVASKFLKFANFIIPGDTLVNTYSDAFIKAYNIKDDQKEKVTKIITSLFATGVDGAKEKKLIITEKPDNTVDIELVLVNGGKDTIESTSKFEDYLNSLGDGIMPI